MKMKLKDLQLIIVTGLSGAGKTQAIRCLEDLNYFCVDNLPPSLVPMLLDEIIKTGENITKVALVMDIRGGKFFTSLDNTLSLLNKKGLNYRILFLDASNEVLVRRFKETRRGHPLSQVDGIIEGIIEERKILAHLKSRAEIVLDTSDMSTSQLKGQINNIFGAGDKDLPVSVISFGFKYGIPMDADLVVDVRFIPNPYYDLGLRALSGHDQKVKDFVINNDVTQKFINIYTQLLKFLIPHYKKEGKSHLVIAIGCTGGRHRSVAIANYLSQKIEHFDCNVITKHRDITRESGGIYE
jgi:UPF0042 nucleotide-binding protein